MKIISAKFIENDEQCFNTFKNKNLIFSDKNSKGKSTYIRMIFFGLGYQIPSMQGLDFNKISTELVIENNQIKYLIKRKNRYLDVENLNSGKTSGFSLPNEHIAFLQYVFESNNCKVLNNLLGIIYIDQEKGWTLLNRGIVIGRLRFSIEELISGLAKIDCDELILQKKKLVDDEEKYAAMLDINELSSEVLEKNGEILSSTEEEDLEAKKAFAQMRIQKIKNDIKNIELAIQQDENLFKFVDSMELQIKNNNEIINVTRENILYSTDNVDYLKMRKNILTGELNTVLNEKNQIEQKLKKLYVDNNPINSLLGEPIEKQIDKQLAKFSFDSITLQNLLEDTRKKKREITKIIKTKLKVNNLYIQKIYNYVREFSEYLGITDKISSNKEFIFTSDLKGFSGAVLQKIVIVFKIAFLKVIEDELGTKLFMVLDSPRGRELDEENSKMILNMIKERLSDNQIIVASIYKDMVYDNVIFIDKYAIEEHKQSSE